MCFSESHDLACEKLIRSQNISNFVDKKETFYAMPSRNLGTDELFFFHVSSTPYAFTLFIRVHVRQHQDYHSRIQYLVAISGGTRHAYDSDYSCKSYCGRS